MGCILTSTRRYAYLENGTRVEKSFERQALKCRAEGGTLTLTFRDATTRPIPHDATALVVERTLRELPTIGTVSVAAPSGNATGRLCDDDANNVTVTFTSELGDVPLLRIDGAGLLPRGGADVAVSEATKGTKDDAVCSRHGLCDAATGTCACFPGYSTSNADNGFGLRGDCGVARTAT